MIQVLTLTLVHLLSCYSAAAAAPTLNNPVQFCTVTQKGFQLEHIKVNSLLHATAALQLLNLKYQFSNDVNAEIKENGVIISTGDLFKLEMLMPCQ